MRQRYVTFIDDEGRIARVIPFDDCESNYQHLEGEQLGCSALREKDKEALMAAYGRALVEKDRVHCSYRWTEDEGKTRLELDILRFPSIQVSAFVLSEVVPAGERPELTDRETEILQLAANDATDAEIARKLKITKVTVARHKQNVRNKLGAREWGGAVARALRMGLISLG